MIDFLYNQYIYMRALLADYGDDFSGIYLAIMLSLVLIVIYERNNKEHRNYVIYVSIFLVFFFLPSLMPETLKVLFGSDYATETYMIFPAMLTFLIGLLVVLNYYKKKDDITIKRKYILILVIFFVFAEASVPFQLTFRQFVVPKFQGKIESEAIEISEIVGNQSVVLPSELQTGIKVCNWNSCILLESTTQSTDVADSVFIYARDNNISYVVIEHTNYLGKTNDKDIKSVAGKYFYEHVENVGEYLVFKAL